MKLGQHEKLIIESFDQFHNEWVKIGDFLLIAYFGPALIRRDMCLYIPFFQVNISSLELKDWTGSIETKDWKNYIDTFLMMLCGGIPWQPYYQRALAVKTTKNAQMLSVIATMGCFLFMIPPVLIGGAAKAASNVTMLQYNVTNYPFLVLPASLVTLTPYWASLLGLSAVR